MNESILEKIQSSAKALKIDLYTAELASYADEKELTPEALEAAMPMKKNLRRKLWRQSAEFLNTWSRKNMTPWSTQC